MSEGKSIRQEFAGVIPHLEDYFGLWLIEPTTGQAIASKINGLDLHAHIAAVRSSGRTFATAVDDITSISEAGVGVITIEGVLQPRESSAYASTPTPLIRKSVRAMAADDSVKHIVLHINSPGGVTTGIAEAAEAISVAAEIKPVTAFIEGIGASAAYYLASQASQVIASQSATVGSIGVYTVVQDSSAQAAMMGVKVHVVKSGDLKAGGLPGTEVTAELLQHIQEDLIDPTAAAFSDAVQSGRDLSSDQLAKVTNGKSWKAGKAIQLGLVDAVANFDDFLSHLEAKLMADNTPKAASVAQLKAEFPNASSEFILAQAEAEATLEDARKAYTKHVDAELAKERAERVKAEAAAKEAAAKASESPKVDGVDSLKSTARKSDAGTVELDAYDDDLTQFKALVQAQIATGKSRQAAYSQVAFEHPDLMRRMSEAGTAAYQKRIAARTLQR